MLLRIGVRGFGGLLFYWEGVGGRGDCFAIAWRLFRRPSEGNGKFKNPMRKYGAWGTRERQKQKQISQP